MGSEMMLDMAITEIQDRLKKYGVQLIKKGNSYSIDRNNKRSMIVVSILLDVEQIEEYIHYCYKFLKGEEVEGSVMPLTDDNVAKMKKIIKSSKEELQVYLDELKKYEV